MAESLNKRKIQLKDIIYLKNNDPNKKKLDIRYIGPYTVTETSSRGKWIKVEGCSSWHHVNDAKLWKRGECGITDDTTDQ